ncbi:hypothetical protein KVR01_004282 [Diaporthe batatas]|uniref:uncharacterized protein n=1 Tax=Diaporthe batatas TaxID=748121 RepID=UPI001D05B39E|nr:uncharacterized protein KVR01_004282 [Diaporthe batatas]KAG8165730.1 hypothetical protein KVR01_004282 [Diaporthe batatas]
MGVTPRSLDSSLLTAQTSCISHHLPPAVRYLISSRPCVNSHRLTPRASSGSPRVPSLVGDYLSHPTVWTILPCCPVARAREPSQHAIPKNERSGSTLSTARVSCRRPNSAAFLGLSRLSSARMTSSRLLHLAVLALFVPRSWQQRDPVQNFCRRFGHQSTVVDDKLYLDGGLINWSPISTNSQNYSNTWLSYNDLQKNSGSGMPPLHANLSKNASIPDVNGGVLWGDEVNKRFYLFGGEYYGTPPTPFNLYSYDILNDSWDNLGPPSQSGIRPVSYGAGTGISELGLGFYYGGWLSNNSVPDWSGPPVATTGLIKYDMDEGSWTNSSGPDSIGRAEGTMNYLPASDGGLLIYFGGIQDLDNGTTAGQPMDEVFVYDIVTDRWYTQQTSGTTPQMRSRFCSGVTWADDQSSYNIYLYGGAGMPPDTSGFDDVYILTIPTFTWIKLYPTDGNVTGQYPHHSLTCNVVNRGQMLVIGGTFPLSDDCDAAPQRGTHNLVLGQQADPGANPWQLYAPDLTTYAVPDEIISVVGGQATGGATRTAPAGGFDNRDLDVLMTKRASVAARTPTRPIPGATGTSSSSSGGTRLSTGAIVGIAVGGGVALVALVVGLCVFFRRHRRFRYGASGAQNGGPKSSAGGSSSPYTFSPGAGPWSPHSAYSGGAAAQAAHTPSSFGGPPSPFARRPSNLNVQQGPVELAAAPVPDGLGDYEMSQGGGGGGGAVLGPRGSGSEPEGYQQRRSLRTSHRSVSSSGVGVPAAPFYGDQPKYDDSGRPWYPQVSRMDDGPFPSPRSVSTGGGGGGGRHSSSHGHSPAQEMMDSSWPLGGVTGAGPSPRTPGFDGADTGWDDSRDGTVREGRRSGRHETFYHP